MAQFKIHSPVPIRRLILAGWRTLKHILRHPSSFRKGIGYLLLMGSSATIARVRESIRFRLNAQDINDSVCLTDPPRLSSAVLETAQQIIAEAALFEPEILLTDQFLDIGRLPIVRGIARNPLIDAWKGLFCSLKTQYRYLIFVPHLTRGGADLVAVNAVRAAIERYGVESTLLILTDYSQSESIDWLPPHTHVSAISDFAPPSLAIHDRARLIEMLVMALRPRAILNINSGACWAAIKQRGAWLASVTDVYVALFCRDYLEDGRAAGYIDTHFRPCLPYIKAVYCDNDKLPQWLCTHYGLPASEQSKLIIQLQPKSPLAKPRGFLRDRDGARLPVLWAGRFCRQKNIDLLIDIATESDRFQFDVYGSGDEQYVRKLASAARRLPNLIVKGPFESTESLPTERYAVLLYTSLWDGLPLIINSAAALGLPIIASDVGGISQLVDDKTGWLIRDYADPRPYIEALNDVWHRPDEAAIRAKRMLERIQRQCSWESYKRTFETSPSFLD